MMHRVNRKKTHPKVAPMATGIAMGIALAACGTPRISTTIAPSGEPSQTAPTAGAQGPQNPATSDAQRAARLAELSSYFKAEPPATLIATCKGTGQGSTEKKGTDGDDRIEGSSGGDLILAGAGQDTVSGMDGDDVIDGGAGNDTANGNQGKDRVHGGDGDDRVLGGAGDDCVVGDNGNDEVIGGDGGDYLFGGDGNDTLYPGTAPDSQEIACTASSYSQCAIDWLSGGTGLDRYMVRDGSGLAVILPDKGNDNEVVCKSEKKVEVVDSARDRFLIGNGFVVKIVDFNVPGETSIKLSGCQ